MKQFKLLGILCLLLFLVGCGSSKLAENYDKDTIYEKAQEVIMLANEGKYDEITALAELPKDTTAEDFAKLVEEGWNPILKDKGNFVEITQHEIAGQHDKKTNQDYAVIAVAVKYEEGICVYTLYYNEDYELVGLYLK